MDLLLCLLVLSYVSQPLLISSHTRGALSEWILVAEAEEHSSFAVFKYYAKLILLIVSAGIGIGPLDNEN